MNKPPVTTEAASHRPKSPPEALDVLDKAKPVTRDDCYRYVDEFVFMLRPEDYRLKHPQWPGLVGLEIEMLAVQNSKDQKDSLPPVSQLFMGADPTSRLLEEAGQKKNWKLNYTEDDHGEKRLLTAQLPDGDLISFEPGGQVEVSTKPYPCLG